MQHKLLPTLLFLASISYAFNMTYCPDALTLQCMSFCCQEQNAYYYEDPDGMSFVSDPPPCVAQGVCMVIGYNDVCMGTRPQSYNFQEYTGCEANCLYQLGKCGPLTYDDTPDPCESMDCPQKCDGTAKKLFTNGHCENGQCKYAETDCEVCADASNCMEICDNAKDDEGNNLEDCKDPACFDSFACACRKETNGGWEKVQKGQKPEAEKLNVIFVGANYDTVDAAKREQQFKSDLANAISGFKKSAPFSTSLSKIRFYGFRVPGSPYAYYYMRPKAAGIAACKTGGNDQYIVLDASPSHGDSNAKLCGGLATIYTNKEPDYGVRGLTLHEFGHSFGCLWDEYASVPKTGWFQGYFINKLLYEAGYAWHEFSYDQSNCATNVSTAKECENHFAAMGVPNQLCGSECTSPTWWRSTYHSVMENAWMSDQYNEVSQMLLNKKLAKYT